MKKVLSTHLSREAESASLVILLIPTKLELYCSQLQMSNCLIEFSAIICSHQSIAWKSSCHAARIVLCLVTFAYNWHRGNLAS